MAKKHQHKISSKTTRSAAGKSWRSDVSESLRIQASDLNFLEQAKKDAKATLQAKRYAERNKRRSGLITDAGTMEDNTAQSPIIDRTAATPTNSSPQELIMWAGRLYKRNKRSKLTPAILIKWLPDNDALISVKQGNNWKEKRARSTMLFTMTDDEKQQMDFMYSGKDGNF